MSLSFRNLKALLAFIVACFVFATGYISVIVLERQSALQKVSRYNTAWNVSQSLSEYNRLGQRIAAVAVPGSGVDMDEVVLRFDILLSRLATMQSGDVAKFLAADPERERVIQRLGEALAKIEPMLSSQDLATFSRDALKLLSPLERPFAALASSANEFGARRVAEDQQELIRLHMIFSLLAGGLIFCGILLIYLLLRHNRLLERTRSRLKRLADEQTRTSAELQRQNSRFDAALNNMSQGLCMVDANGFFIVCNKRFQEIFSVAPHQLQAGRPVEDLTVQPASRSRFVSVYQRQRKLASGRPGTGFTHEFDDGRTIAVLQEPLRDGGWVATYEDISERRRAEQKIAHMAHYDSLTGLANRNLFQEELSRQLSYGQPVTIYLLDLDRFKEVNDTLGHDIGDQLLVRVAERLTECAGADELVARLGGDEFTVLRRGLHEAAAHEAFAARIGKVVRLPFEIEGQEIRIDTSVGIATAETSSTEPEQLLKQADLALYRAKADGRGGHRFFEPAMDAELQARRALEQDLRRALDNDEFELHYQPLIDIKKNEICGFEVLLRWRHPTRGSIPPSIFIPIAEDIGLIFAIGEEVLVEACRTAAGWPNELKVAVNLSAAQFRDRSLVQCVARALEASGLEARRLELEITETVLLEDSAQTLAILHDLRNAGVRIAIDDFGTGYSSLSYLASFPFHKIKIDQTFVRDLTEHSDSLSIVELIVGLGNSLEMTTTAEGVETAEQFAELQKAGCTEAQGFLFAPGRPAHELEFSLSAPQCSEERRYLDRQLPAALAR